MMFYGVLKYTGPRVKGLHKHRKAGYAAVGKLWHRRFRPRHFTKAGARMYHYKAREGEPGTKGSKDFWASYTGRKKWVKKHTLPLVWSGMSRRLTRNRDVRATSKGVRVVMWAPALNLRPKGGRINMRTELTRTTPPEKRALAKVFLTTINRGLKNDKTTTTTRL